jgi:hypothetical protein
MVYLIILSVAQILQCLMVGWLVNNKLGSTWMEVGVAQLMYHPSIYMEQHDRTENLRIVSTLTEVRTIKKK